MLAFKTPSLEDLIIWPDWFGEGTWYGFNKIGAISLLGLVLPTVLFLVANARYKKSLVPSGIQNLTESAYNFIDKQIVRQTIGSHADGYVPLLMAMFFFILVGNWFSVVPTSHMTANARMANPLFLAIVVWLVYVGVGIKHNGIKYFTHLLWPSNVPVLIRPIVGVIEVISTLVVRPISLAVRLFANMLAGHILLATFATFCIALFGTVSPLIIAGIPAFAGLVAFTAFEILVGFIQAYIFCLLTGVYIGSSVHPH